MSTKMPPSDKHQSEKLDHTIYFLGFISNEVHPEQRAYETVKVSQQFGLNFESF